MSTATASPQSVVAPLTKEQAAPEIPTVYLRKGWTSAAVAAGLMLGGALFAFLGGDRTQ